MEDVLDIIRETRELLNSTFDAVDTWFDKDEELREYKPVDGGWSVNQVLEHIGLTDHFLLILINKGAEKAIRNADQLDLQTELLNYHFHRDKLDEIGSRNFEWIRPSHMEPQGDKSPKEVRQQLRVQLNECLCILDKLKNGEGVLCRTTMSVNELGKLDVYEYIYFLARHGQRHLKQMERVEAEFVLKK